MKRFLALTALCLTLTACTPTVNPPTAPASGYNTIEDQRIGQILAGANGFYHGIQCHTQGLKWNQAQQSCVSDPSVSSAVVLTVQEKSVLNQLGLSLNVANPVYLSYHNNPTAANFTAAQNAVNDAQAKLLSAQANIPTVKQ